MVIDANVSYVQQTLKNKLTLEFMSVLSHSGITIILGTI